MKRFFIYASPFSLLGFKRGIEDYDYTHKNKHFTNNTYLYSRRTAIGIIGMVFYVNPFTMPLFICKEIYRLEANIRELEEEKKSDFYNRLF